MTIFQALMMGIVQGLTEFIPVSSSGHLVIFPKLLGWEDSGLAFDTVLHMGTLLALLVYFSSDLKGFFCVFCERFEKKDLKVLRVKPVFFFGLFLQHFLRVLQVYFLKILLKANLGAF
ncbi:MAG: hypothetical protein KatS3mg101_0248 [Patescibacteria group bacterium]|nr:MAG: hypothetical protein KatS3mg101_0248 [Patescibacteria group bacterium]